MPSAASIEISTIFNDVISNNLKYCGVCLRTEEERRLVNPEHFLKCIGIMSLAAPLITTICYVCEAEATRAFALFQAINFAEIINQWFKDMSGKLKYRDEMPDFLDRYINRRARLRGSAPLAEWWRRVRARSDLVQTEVLVVSDAAPVSSAPLAEWWRRVRARSDLVQTEVLVVSDAAPEKADRDEVELCQGPETPRPPDHPPPEAIGDPEIDNIVIIDDEEDPLSLPPTHPPPLTPAPPPINHPLMNDPLQSNYPEQLPIVPEHMPAMMPSVPTIVPIDRLLDSSNPNEIAVIPNEGMILTKNNNNGYILQPLVIGPDGHYHIVSADAAIPDIMANHELMGNHELMTNHELMGNHELMANHDYMGNCQQTFTMQQDNCKILEISPMTEPEPVQEPSNINILGVQTLRDGIVVDEGDGKEAQVVKRPVMSGRIDWEDKIPMDVISFVDSTDTSVISQDSESEKPRRKRHKSDVIDLC